MLLHQLSYLPNILRALHTLSQILKCSQKLFFKCKLFDVDGNQLDTRTIEIGGNDYYNWGNDDSYIINTLSNKLGLTTQPPPIKKTNPTYFTPFLISNADI